MSPVIVNNNRREGPTPSVDLGNLARPEVFPAAGYSDQVQAGADGRAESILGRLTDLSKLRVLLGGKSSGTIEPLPGEAGPVVNLDPQPAPARETPRNTAPEIGRSSPGVSLSPGQDEVRYTLPGSGAEKVVVPSREWLEGASTKDLRDLWDKNHKVLLEYVAGNREALPHLGFHGRTQEKIDELFRDHVGLDRNGWQRSYVQTIERKAADALQLLTDLYQNVGTPLPYSDPKESGKPYIPGGIVVVDMGDFILKDKYLGERVSGGVKTGGYKDSGPGLTPGKNAGETDISIDPDNFNRVVRGVISRDFIDRFKPGADYEHGTMIEYLRNQALLVESLRIAGIGTAVSDSGRSRPEGGAVFPGGSANFNESGGLVDLGRESAVRSTPVRIPNGPKGPDGIDIGESLREHIRANPGDPHLRYHQIEISRGSREGVFNTAEIEADRSVSRNQAIVTIANNGTVIVQNGKEILTNPNYVGKRGSDGIYEWEPVGRNGAVAQPGDALLIAGKYLVELPGVQERSFSEQDYQSAQRAERAIAE